jgi:hypothetical protein
MRRFSVLFFLALSLSLLSTPVRADESGSFMPDPASVQRYGPAYRFPQSGWIVLHIEGEPYERGYQHGRLLAPEILGYLKCFAATQGSKNPTEAWKQTRTLANAVLVRKFHKEFLEEMKGIADGVNATGTRFDGRPIDLIDIVALNCWAEIDTLDSALNATANGLEGLRFPNPEKPQVNVRPGADRCSAFAATGPATADGKIVFGHITMFGLYPANFYNVWLDVKPAKGHRMVMCTYPAGIQSGMDYHINSAGILLAETTIGQTPFNPNGLTETSRVRQAIQYGDSIDKVVEILKKDNNGLYTNEWLIGDINTNEVAMFELGTHKSKLWRSSKNEWIGDTPGFYWGCNNARDLDVRLETIASVNGRPGSAVFVPTDRDIKWQQLYQKHKGKIGVAFGKEAFTTPPIAASHSLDAKFTTTALAKELKSYALFGPPLGRTWHPTVEEKQRYPEVKPLISNPWTILHALPPPKANGTVAAVDLGGKSTEVARKGGKPKLAEPAWHGTILPKTDADYWLSAAFAGYERYVSREKSLRGGKPLEDLGSKDRQQLAVELFGWKSNYLTAVRSYKDMPLAKIQATPVRDEWARIAAGKGVLFLHELRHALGDALFEQTMDSFGRANAGKQVTTAMFRECVEKAAAGKSLASLFDTWLNETGLPTTREQTLALANGDTQAGGILRNSPLGNIFTVMSFGREEESTLIVYGTGTETPTNREAAEALQKAMRERFSNFTMPIKADRDVTEDEMKSHHLVLIGRPDSNCLVEKFRKAWPIAFGKRSFVVAGDTFAHAGSAVVAAAENPMNPRYSVVVLAGLGAEATWHTPHHLMRMGRGEVLLLPHGMPAQSLVLPARELVYELK